MFGHRNFASPAAGIKPMTYSSKGQCANHEANILSDKILKELRKEISSVVWVVFMMSSETGLVKFEELSSTVVSRLDNCDLDPGINPGWGCCRLASNSG